MILISFTPRLLNHVSASLALAAALAPPLPAQDNASELARRIADIASIAIAEYAEGVVDGAVVLPEEFEEARLFLAEASRLAAGLPTLARDRIAPHLRALQEGVEALDEEPALQTHLAGLRGELQAALGVTLDVLPARAPSLARGAELYGTYCVPCHGAAGGGDGPLGGDLDPPPAALNDFDALRTVPPVEFYRKINVGVAGTAMPGFADRLGVEERWALALYSSTLRHPRELADRGAALLGERCPTCALLASDFHATAMMSDDSLAAAIASRASGRLDAGASRAATAFAREAGAAERLGSDRGLEAARVVAEVRRGIAEAEALAEAGERRGADDQALGAYLVFERIESGLRARDAAAARRVERAFAAYRAALLSGPSAAWEASRGDVDRALDDALARLTARPSTMLLFGQSFVIMLREGLEAILIIGALVAVLGKAGAPERKREIGWGVLVALAASGLTAVAFATLFKVSTAQQEFLEGITMLVAAAVLFWVSYWLVSKIEMRKWQAFVTGQISKALGSGRIWALAAVAFLAVYREGFETVLFYAALFAGADAGGVTSVAAGMVVGGAVLAVVYYLVQRYGVRLPLKPFFGVTSALLYVMAFSFAGHGVAELQEAGVISMTPLQWLPALPALGIFPTLQTAASQAVLALALAAALLWVFWLEPRAVRARAIR
jgi:high-affinity iron transporter